MRSAVGGKAAHGFASSPSQLGRFETQWLAAPENLSALSDLSGQWIDIVHDRRPPRGIVLDGFERQPDPWRAGDERLEWSLPIHRLPPLFVFNQFADLERCILRPGNVNSADNWQSVLKLVIVRYQGSPAHLLPCRCRLCHAGSLRVPRSQAGQICDPHSD